jgi:hypothetical protein
MVPAAVPLAEHVPVAPEAFTVNNEGATEFAVARGAAAFATTIVTVIASPVFAVVPPPTVFAAVMLEILREAGFTAVALKLPVAGHWLQLSGFATVPFTETEIAPLPGLEGGVTVQSAVRLVVLEILWVAGSALLLHPVGTVNTGPTLVQLPPETL